MWQILGVWACALVAGYLFGHNRGFRKGRRIVIVVGTPSRDEAVELANAIANGHVPGVSNDND